MSDAENQIKWSGVPEGDPERGKNTFITLGGIAALVTVGGGILFAKAGEETIPVRPGDYGVDHIQNDIRPGVNFNPEATPTPFGGMTVTIPPAPAR